jgi:hypothetical protein
MNFFLLYFLLWLWDNHALNSVTKSNKTKVDAAVAFQAGDYTQAAELYQQLTYGSFFSDPAARLNLAQAYLYKGDSREAARHFELLQNVEDKRVASMANMQLGQIAIASFDTATAVQRLKLAMKLNDRNEAARYNYELLMLSYKGETKKEDTPKPPPPPQPKNTSSESEQAPEESEERKEFLKRLQKMNMSEEQARAILETMKTNEMHYIYQLRRRQYRNKEVESQKVEW